MVQIRHAAATRIILTNLTFETSNRVTTRCSLDITFTHSATSIILTRLIISSNGSVYRYGLASRNNAVTTVALANVNYSLRQYGQYADSRDTHEAYTIQLALAKFA